MQWQISGALMPKSLAEIDDLGLIISTLMLEVMRLRNTYKYDVVAPKAMQNEMDVAYHKAILAINTLIASGQREVLELVLKDIVAYPGYVPIGTCRQTATEIVESRLKELDGR